VIDPEDLPLAEGLVQLVVQLIALCRSVPNGFSITTRERSTRSASAAFESRPAPHRRNAQVVQPTHRTAQLLLGELDGLGRPSDPTDCGT
jgi:hypothetical protein